MACVGLGSRQSLHAPPTFPPDRELTHAQNQRAVRKGWKITKCHYRVWIQVRIRPGSCMLICICIRLSGTFLQKRPLKKKGKTCHLELKKIAERKGIRLACLSVVRERAYESKQSNNQKQDKDTKPVKALRRSGRSSSLSSACATAPTRRPNPQPQHWWCGACVLPSHSPFCTV